jgi:hypothetical protein
VSYLIHLQNAYAGCGVHGLQRCSDGKSKRPEGHPNNLGIECNFI